MERSHYDICRFTTLCVEDDADTREMVGRALYLNFPDMRLLFAEDGLDAIAKTTEHRPDIYLIDLTLPSLDGFELSKRILALDRECRIIVISRDGNRERIEGCLKIGVAAYFVKPFSVALLLAKIAEITEDLFQKRLEAARASTSAVAL